MAVSTYIIPSCRLNPATAMTMKTAAVTSARGTPTVVPPPLHRSDQHRHRSSVQWSTPYLSSNSFPACILRLAPSGRHPYNLRPESGKMSLVSLRERKNVLLLHPVRFYCSYFVHARQPMSWSPGGGNLSMGSCPDLWHLTRPPSSSLLFPSFCSILFDMI